MPPTVLHPEHMSDTLSKPRRNPSWKRTLLLTLLICLGSVMILLPAWLPNRPGVPMERGTVEFLQAMLLAAAAAVMLGTSSHAAYYRPVCRVLALGFLAAFIGEIEDFLSGILGIRFPESWCVGAILSLALITLLRHRKVMLHFLSVLGHHAASGLIAGALLILYVFNRVIGGARFWQATLGESFSNEVPKVCRSYLELLACYLLFIGALGYSVTLARRRESN